MDEEEVRQGMMGADVQTQATPEDKDKQLINIEGDRESQHVQNLKTEERQ